MADLVPEGCISLVDAWDQFQGKLWNGHDPHRELCPYPELNSEVAYSDLCPETATRLNEGYEKIAKLQSQEIDKPFASGILEAMVRQPGETDNRCIPKSSWVDGLCTERLFMSAEIEGGHGDITNPEDVWTQLVGRTPFVKHAQFDDWLDGYISRINQPGNEDTPVRFALRCHLIELAAEGLISSTRIEELVREWGMSPLASKPNHADFDPMILATWSLPMAVAWIVWLTPDSVRQQWDEYLSECWDWHSFIRRNPKEGEEGWIDAACEELRALKPASFHMLGLMESNRDGSESSTGRADHLSVNSAQVDLWRKLQEGTITATGINQDGQIIEIPKHEWAYLELSGRQNGYDTVNYQHQPLQPVYSDLTFPKKAVTAIWPVETKSSNGRLKSAGTAAGESSCRKWLEGLMRKSPDKNSSPKDALFAEVRDKFIVSRRSFDNAWSEAMEETGAESWSHAGRKPKQK